MMKKIGENLIIYSPGILVGLLGIYLHILIVKPWIQNLGSLT